MTSNVTALHGTDSTKAESILAGGFRDDAPRRSDPGDFGWALYLTSAEARARAIGRVVLVVTVDATDYHHFPTMEEAYDWMEAVCLAAGFPGGTLHDADRAGAARACRSAALQVGWRGLRIDNRMRGAVTEDYEVVVFDFATIRGLEKKD